MASDPVAPRPERRRAPRQRVLKGALIVFGAREDLTFDCRIRNLTADGAKLQLGSTQGVPDAFHLLIPQEFRIAPAQAIWRNAREIGIGFTGPFRPHLTAPKARAGRDARYEV
jgi:hypothetical protein